MKKVINLKNARAVYLREYDNNFLEERKAAVVFRFSEVYNEAIEFENDEEAKAYFDKLVSMYPHLVGKDHFGNDVKDVFGNYLVKLGLLIVYAIGLSLLLDFIFG